MPRRTNIADSGQVSDLLHFDGGREIAINVMPMRSRYLGLLPRPVKSSAWHSAGFSTSPEPRDARLNCAVRQRIATLWRCLDTRRGNRTDSGKAVRRSEAKRHTMLMFLYVD